MMVKERLDLRILGTFSVAAGGDKTRLVELPSGRHRALLAYLALKTDFSESRERLAALLWGDSTDGTARKRFRQSLLRLRGELTTAGVDPFVGERDTLALDPGAISVDARQFLELSKGISKGDLDAATELYRGELLDGLDLDSAPFDDWLRRERYRLRTVAAQVFERCAQAREASGDADGAVTAAEQLVALDPSDESTQRQLIGLLSRSRGKTAALAQAETLRQYMRDEFGSDLEAETLNLISSLKTASTAPATAAAIHDAPLAEAVEASAPTDQNASDVHVDAPAPDALHATPPFAWLRPRQSLSISLPVLAIGLFIAVTTIYIRAQGPTRQAAASPTAAVVTREVSWQPPGSSHASAAVTKAIEGRGISALVVLPFSGRPADSPESVRMADLITEDLINELSRVPSLRVIAKSTSLKYAKQPVDVATLGSELGVQYAIDGDVRLDDKQLRANIALIDTATRLQVWTGRYERDESDRLKVQDEIARALARQLHVGIMESRGRAAATATDPNIDAMLSKGWAALNQFAFFRGGKEAGQIFQDVLVRDHDNVSALIGLGAYKATAYNTRQTEERSDDLLRDAEALLKRAQSIEPQASLPLYFLGRLAMWRRQPDDALSYFQRTLELNPSSAPAYGSIGYVLLHTDRLQEALDNLLYAVRLSPNDHYMGLWSAHIGRAYLEIGDVDAAERWMTQSVKLMPNSALNRAALAALYSNRGKDAAAAAQIAEMKKLGSSGSIDDLIARYTVLCLQDRDRPKQLIAGLRKVMAPN